MMEPNTLFYSVYHAIPHHATDRCFLFFPVLRKIIFGGTLGIV